MSPTHPRFVYSIELRSENGNSTEIFNSSNWQTACLVFEEACQDPNYVGKTIILEETVKHVLHPDINVATYTVRTFYVV